MSMIKQRIEILDGFRAIAILAVILYHYFSRWTYPISTISLYPYNDAFAYFPYGRLGVQFFFIISGFVIFFTLENTDRFGEFWKKRMIRLWPAMLIASIVTLVVLRVFDRNFLFKESHELRNFVPALTFINPDLFNRWISSRGHEFGYINGSYWSLWPEIQFYFLASILFYLRKDSFLRNFIIMTFVFTITTYLYTHIMGSNKLNLEVPSAWLQFYSIWFIKIFNIGNHLPFFCIGMIFYVLFKEHHLNKKVDLFVGLSLTLLIIYEVYAGEIFPIRLIYVVFFSLFLGFVYTPKVLHLLTNSKITLLGRSSYFLYLIHENIGVLIIATIGKYFVFASPVFTLLLIMTMIGISILYTERVDNAIAKYLKSIWLKNAKPSP